MTAVVLPDVTMKRPVVISMLFFRAIFHKKEEMMGTICIYIVQLGSMFAPISTNLDRVGAPSLDVQTWVLGHFGGAPRGTNRSLSGVGHFDTSNFDAENICGHWALGMTQLTINRQDTMYLCVILAVVPAKNFFSLKPI